MSQSQTVTLDDKEVSRRLAHKATLDKGFEHVLLACANPDFASIGKGSGENYISVSRAIIAIRAEMVKQAGLRVPLLNGVPQDLTTYLKKMRNSRLILGKVSMQKVDGVEVSAVERNREWGWVGNVMCMARLAATIHQSTRRFQADPTPFPFERLPPELRLQVYRESLIGASNDSTNASAQYVTVTPARGRINGSNFQYESLHRSTLNEINVDLLAASRLLNNEAIPVLYQLRTFNFKTDVGSAERFLRSVPEQGRRNLHGIAIEYHDKQQQDYCCFPQKTFGGKGPGNKAAWSKACAYIADNVNVKALSLTINVKVPSDFKRLRWVRDVIKVKKLKSVVLKVSQHERSGPCTVRASCKGGTLSATDPCFSEHLVPLYEYLLEEMLEKTS